MIDYSAFNKDVFEKVPGEAVSILDVGCGTGVMGKALKDKVPERKVFGVTYSTSEASAAEKILDKVWVADINHEVPNFEQIFDCMIFSHILEHTFDPEKVLKSFTKYLKDGGIVIIALPNILYFKQRMEFFKGNFQYSEEGGLMDITHFRFFDWKSAKELINRTGLQMISKNATGNFPLPFIRKIVPSICKFIDKKAIEMSPGLFGFQFIFIAKKLP